MLLFMNMKKKILIIVVFFVLFPLGLGLHEASIRYFPDKTCIICHEMKDPIKRWRDSGVGKNHTNCAGCHFDTGLVGWMDMNISSVKQLIVHFKRDPNEPLKSREEPLFLNSELEPGYWSHVPNSRCFSCKDAKNHREIDQRTIHSKLINDIFKQPCKDCHSHEMRNGQKFFEKVIPKEIAAISYIPSPLMGEGKGGGVIK
jgi:trimethylamine-N-oxide reductase (cytochrome c) cytochrome c-type subunit TorY